MPVQYKGLVAEHNSVRSQVGMFDVSHMGKFAIAGEGVLETLNKLVPSNLGRLKVGQALYTVLLNEQAGIIDDVIFYRHEPEGDRENWSVIVNASTTEKDKVWLQQQLGDRLIDNSASQILIAVQGKTAIATLQELVTADLLKLPRLRFGHTRTDILGTSSFIARTGYTGEDGVEISVPVSSAADLWNGVVGVGVKPAGLGARDTLRLEAGLPLHGHELGPGITSLQARLGWAVSWTKGDFRGRTALEREKTVGPDRLLRGLSTEGRRPPREGAAVLLNGVEIGVVTSGNFSPELGHGIALAFLPPDLSIGDEVVIDVRGTQLPAAVTKTPFVARSSD